MEKPVAALRLDDEPAPQRLLQVLVQPLRRFAVDHRQEREIRAVAERRELPQGLLGLARQAKELADHELDDVVRVPLVVDAT